MRKLIVVLGAAFCGCVTGWGANQEPFHGVSFKLPAVIQAEDFDQGGEGISYHYISARSTGVAYRPDTAVNFLPAPEAEPGVMVQLLPGEWLEYTLEVDQPDFFDILLRTGVITQPVRLSLQIEEIDWWYEMSFFSTSPSSEFNLSQLQRVFLPPGRFVLRVTCEENLFQGVDTIEFIRRKEYPREFYAGGDQPGHVDGFRREARFSSVISGLAFDQLGNLYVADAGNRRIRRISPEGEVTTVAGTGQAGSQDGPGMEASFNNMNSLGNSIAVDPDGNCYVIDMDFVGQTNRIRRVDPQGMVRTVYTEPRLVDLPYGRTGTNSMAALAMDSNGFLALASNTEREAFPRRPNNIAIHLFSVEFQPVKVFELETYNPRGDITDLSRGPNGQISFILKDSSYYNHWIFSLEPDPGIRSWQSQVISAGTMRFKGELFPEFLEWSTIGLAPLALTFSYTDGLNQPGSLMFAAERIGHIYQIMSDKTFRSRSLNSFVSMGGLRIASDAKGDIYEVAEHRLFRHRNEYGLMLDLTSDDEPGRILVDPPGPYVNGAEVQVTAQPLFDWQFLHWTNALTSTEPIVNLVVTQSLAARAVFGGPLSVTIPENSGSVQRHPDAPLYPYGTQVEVSVEPAPDHKWLGWADGVMEPSRVVEITGQTLLSLEGRLSQVTAPALYTFRARSDYPVAGEVLIEPEKDFYEFGEEVLLTAVPKEGFVFQAWPDGSRENPRRHQVYFDGAMLAIIRPGEPVKLAPGSRTRSVLEGGNIELRFELSGAPPIQLQWFYNETALPGATEPALFLSQLTREQSGVYRLEATNARGSASAVTTLNIFPRNTMVLNVRPQTSGPGLEIVFIGDADGKYRLESTSGLEAWLTINEFEYEGGEQVMNIPDWIMNLGTRFFRIVKIKEF